MTVQVFVDETKRRGFAMVAIHARAEHIAKQRRQLRQHLRSGQRRIHFQKESPARRRTVMAMIAEWPITVHVYVSADAHQNEARQRCLAVIASDIVSAPAINRLVIERDESRESNDRRILTEAMRGQPRPISWEIQDGAGHEMLWVADAIAWCWPHPNPHWRALLATLDLTESFVDAEP